MCLGKGCAVFVIACAHTHTRTHTSTHKHTHPHPHTYTHTHTHTHTLHTYTPPTHTLQAVVTEIKRMNNTGQPVLVGTTSVEKSEVLSAMLQEAGIQHQVSLGSQWTGKLVVSRGGDRSGSEKAGY